MSERQYQSYLIKKLREMFPGCLVIKNDPSYIQGIPDLIILYRNKWAALEVKLSEGSESRPNQAYYVELMGDMGFASYIYPENEDEVLNELQRAFRFSGKARFSKS